MLENADFSAPLRSKIDHAHLPAVLSWPDHRFASWAHGHLPMGHMIGSYLVFVPRAGVGIDNSVEEAMRACLFAWMSTAA
jgi:hypothetical protein